MKIKVNQKNHNVKVDDDTPLLWTLREELGLTGTKYSCGKGVCGSCTVMVDGKPTRSCITPSSAVKGSAVETIESYMEGDHPIQKAWVKHSVAQCGYCQSGQIMQSIGFLNTKKRFTKKEALEGLSQNLCRCGSYNKIKDALLDACKEMGKIL